MDNDILAEHRMHFDGAIEHFKREMTKIRTGRATPALVEDLLVDYYGTRTPLKQMANIAIPESRQIVIQPWDTSALSLVDSAIKAANIGVTPQNDGTVLRIMLPALNEEQRREFVKILNRKAEEARVSVRQVREDAWKAIQDAEKTGDVSEDEKFATKDALQRVVDEYNAMIESLRKGKEGEIMTI